MQKIVMVFSGLVLFLLWENLRPGFAFGSKHVLRTLSNFGVALTNIVVARLFYTLPMVWISAREFFPGFGLLKASGLSGFPLFAAAFLLLDLWSYWWHRFNHTIRFLWRFHKAHHTDTEMAASTAFRFHPVEILFSSLLRIPLFIILGIPADALLWYETLLVFSTLFHHSNILIPLKADSLLRLFIVSPVMHKLHHSVKPVEFMSNYSSFFSFWDRLFQSYTETDQPGAIMLGLRVYREERHQHYFGIIMTPFLPSGKKRNQAE